MSHSGLVRSPGKRIGCKPSRVRIPSSSPYKIYKNYFSKKQQILQLDLIRSNNLGCLGGEMVDTLALGASAFWV